MSAAPCVIQSPWHLEEKLRETPEQRYWLAKQRQTEQIREAALYRLARSQPDESIDHIRVSRFASLRTRLAQVRFGRVRALVARAISMGEAPCNDPCPDAAA